MHIARWLEEKLPERCFSFHDTHGDTMNQIAESYVKLVLALGQHDEDYVDAYHGPKEWMKEAEEMVKFTLSESRGSFPNLSREAGRVEGIEVEIKGKIASLENIRSQAKILVSRLATITPPTDDEIAHLRYRYLSKQIHSLIARTEALLGKKFSFDEESEAYYDAVAPTYPEDHFRKIRNNLDSILPGSGNIPQRYEHFKNQFIIPREKLDAVFSVAIEECRKRTKEHIALPPNESFHLEYVNKKPWSGYNWFKGNAYSLIQLNTDLPIFIDRAVDLAAHEGYPGHHVYNSLLELHLFRQKGWVEFSVFPLFSPQALIAEGTANHGIEIVFTPQERIAFEREILFPLAGLDSSKVELYYTVHELSMQLAYAGNEAARGYLDGKVTAEKAIEWLIEYALMSRQRAEQRVKFFEKYRSYVINYNLGQDLVKGYLERRGATPHNPAKRWEEFAKLLASPRLPSGLR